MEHKQRRVRRNIDYKKLAGALLLVFGVLIFALSCVPSFLNIGKFFQGVFGVLVYPIGLLMVLVGIALLMNLRYTLNSRYVAYLTISFICLLSLFHIIFTTKVLHGETTGFAHYGKYLNICFTMRDGITVGGVLLGAIIYLVRASLTLAGAYVLFGIFATIFIGLTVDYIIYNRKKNKTREKLSKVPVVDNPDIAPFDDQEITDEQLYSFSTKRKREESFSSSEVSTIKPFTEEFEPTPIFQATDNKTQEMLDSDEDVNFSFNINQPSEEFNEPQEQNSSKDYARSVLYGSEQNEEQENEEPQVEEKKSAREILYGEAPKVPNIFDRSSEERDAWRRQYASKPLAYQENLNNQEEQVQENPFNNNDYDQADDGAIKTSWGTYRPTTPINENNRGRINRDVSRGRDDSINLQTGDTFGIVGAQEKTEEDSNRVEFGSVLDRGNISRNSRNVFDRNNSRFDSIDREEKNEEPVKPQVPPRIRERTSLSNFNRLSNESPQEESSDFNSRLSSHENRINRNNDFLANASSLGIETKNEEQPSFTSILNQTKKEEKEQKEDVSKREKPIVEKISFESQLNTKYNAPPTTLLNLIKEEKVDYSVEYKEKSAIIENTLSNFKIPAKVNNVVRGPKVTRYELAMPLGIPVSRVLSYEKDLAMGLASKSGVRIEAPIPGKNAFGIEVENAKPSMVGFRELVESKEFNNFKNPLPVAVGKNISGEIIVKSLAKMVHCLVAGSTGSGKSVFLHSLIVSLMYRHSPEELRFIMIDPKRVEFSRYNRMPHLMLPEVVTECSKAVNSLNWAVKEMERRYELLKVNDCQKIEQFNECSAVKKGEEKKLPYLVIVVDELAELMSVAAKEAESRIQRITQLGRAAGIHMVIATQRPSVDVVTGVIKNNLPTRIAFALASAVDSQTIINQGGAEKLLGQGDMLLSAQDSNATVRLQAAFVDDDEIKKVLNYIKEHNISVYDEEIQKSIYADPEPEANSSASGGDSSAGNNEDKMDELMPQALKLVMKNGKASISMIQRRFSVGYARAARIIDQMETRGFIEEGGLGNKPRDIKITIAEYNELFGDFDSD